MLMGVAPDGILTGIEIVAHKETPGLGDKIAKKEWRETFKGKSLQVEARREEGRRRDRPVLGATISPRAVTKAVKEGLKFVEKEYGKEVRGSERGVRSKG